MRVSVKQVEQRIENTNSMLPKEYQLELGNRYGYYAIDIKDLVKGDTSRNTYDCGLTLRAAFDIVCAMGAVAYQLKKKRSK